MMKSLWIALIVVAVSFVPRGEAGAAPAPSTSNVDRAREYFKKGVALYKERGFDAALAEFEKAYELAPDYRLLYNLAQVQIERHDYVSALSRFRDYLREGGGQIATERRAEVETELANLAGLVAELSVVADADGAELVIDGVRIGSLPLAQPVLVNAGVRSVLVRKVGYAPASQVVTIAGGEPHRLELKLQPDPGPQARVEVPASRMTAARPGSARTAMWISLVATGVLGASSATLAILSNHARSNFERDLDTYPASRQQIDDDRSTLKTYAALTDGLGAAALVSAGIFTYCLLSGGSGESGAAQAVRIRVAPAWSGVRVSGDF